MVLVFSFDVGDVDPESFGGFGGALFDHSGSMEVITPLYVSRMLNVPLDEVEAVMKDMEL